MDALKKWMIIRFTPYKTTPPLKWMFTQKLVFKSSLLLNAECVIQELYVPPTSSHDLCIPFCIYPSSMENTLYIIKLQKQKYSASKPKMLYKITTPK